MLISHRTSRRAPAYLFRKRAAPGGQVVRSRKEQEMLLGTLDMLVLQTLITGPAHGHTIAHVIEHTSDDVLQIEQGSLYPALHRLEDRGWVSSYWGPSENNRKARYYRLTPLGRKQLHSQTHRWQTMVEAIGRVLAKAGKTAD
jgi:PadR family transcriptional regulator, regulatory protein PadR